MVDQAPGYWWRRENITRRHRHDWAGAVPRILVAGLMAFTIAGTAVATVFGADEDASLDLDRLSAATVLITADPSEPARTGWGSGSIVSDDGLILTNAHVAANRAPGVSLLYPTIRYEQQSPSTLYIYTVDGADGRAEPAYEAEVVAVDGYLDLAVLRIVADADGVPIDPSGLDLTTVQLGDSRELRQLDVLTVAGFPVLADSFTVRFTRGEINNFSDDARVGREAWIHTDVKISGGSSGGLAVDADGRLVAIPTQTTNDIAEDAIVDFNMRPVDLALPLIRAAQTGVPYDAYQHVTRPTSTESARVVGWTTEPSDSCASGGDRVPFGATALFGQIEFDGMEVGDHVLLELVDLGARGSEPVVRDFFAFDWPADRGRSACIPVPFGFDRSFPAGDHGLFPEGDYGVRVRVGPSDELEIAPGPRNGSVTVTSSVASGGRGLRPDTRASSPSLSTRRQVEAALQRRTARAGLDCHRFREEGRFDPFDYEATGAVLCEESLPANVAQVALFQFPTRGSLNEYWQFRLTQLPSTLLTDERACWRGDRGISLWRYGAVACYVSTSVAGTRAARIRWTDRRTNTYGVIDATDLDVPRLFGWWRDQRP